jgi:hypothetical protein
MYLRALKFDPSEPRDERGRWVHQRMAELKAKYPVVAFNYPRSSHTEMGTIEAHTKDVGREWEKQLTHEELVGISERFGSDVEKLMASTVPLHDIGKAQAMESGAGRERQHEYTTPIMQDVLRKEGFSEKDVSLATELTNHDLIGPLFRGYEGFSAKEAVVVDKLKEKAQKVGMNVPDFVKLQLAFYQADASAYPYITQFMTQEPSGKWTFTGNKKIAAIEALIHPLQSVAKFVDILKYDPNEPRNPKGSPLGGQWVGAGGRQFTSEEGYQWHETGPGREWATHTMSPEDHRALDAYVGFGYRQVNELRRGIQPTREVKIRRLTPEEYTAVQAAESHEDIQKMVPPEGQGFRYRSSYEYAKDVPSGPDKLAAQWAVVGPKVDTERLADVTQEANQLDDMIAHRGLVLDEAIEVQRGAYLPGVSVEDLKTLEQYPDDHVWEEKGFTSTFLGEAGGRAKSYPALGKWESLHQRYGSGKLFEHQDDVGTAVRFYITLPKGTKVASAEAARRVDVIYPRTQDPAVFQHPEWTADGKLKPEDFTIPDLTKKPTVRTRDLDDKGQRSESEILLGSGARFRVTKVKKGYTYQTGDTTLKPVDVYEVHMEYIGGGSSDSHGGM